MIVVRYAYALALALWLGGLAVVGSFAAPVLFGHDFTMMALAAGVVLLICLTIMRLVGPRPAAYGVRAGIIVFMLLLTGYTGGPLSSRLEQMRQAAAPVDQLPASDARRIAIEQVHERGTTLLALTLAGALALLYWEARREEPWRARPAATGRSARSDS
ncbi:MAG TPA: hypothetical protein VIC33_17120 [Vicinamibacterales bacterium]